LRAVRPFLFAVPFLCVVATGCTGSNQAAMPPPSGGPVASASVAATGSPARSASATAAATTVPLSYWSGTVSDVYTNGIIANCGQSNFAQGYGCLPVLTGSATITGTPKVGQYFQLWGDLSRLPNISATFINYGSTPFPATGATLPPSVPATPTPTPTSAASAYWAGTVSGVTATASSRTAGKSISPPGTAVCR